jgi:UDP-glucose 4-epimerase
VKANILAAESDASGIYNVGRGERNTVTRLSELIIQIIGKKLDTTYEEERPGDVKHSLADISQAAGFGYNPEYRLEQGLKKTIEEYTGGS